MTTASQSEIDAATIAAFQNGDDEAFARVSRRHFRELHVHCYRMIGSFDEAEDLVQETLLRAWRHRDSYEGRSTLRAWLYRIATNACIDALRKRDVREPAGDESAEEETAAPGTGAPDYARFPWLQPYPDATSCARLPPLRRPSCSRGSTCPPPCPPDRRTCTGVRAYR